MAPSRIQTRVHQTLWYPERFDYQPERILRRSSEKNKIKTAVGFTYPVEGVLWYVWEG